MTFRTRFAPSPTGPLHLGHAYSAMLGFDMAMAEGGEWLLRIEDIDKQRSKPEWEAAIYEDLEWLGLWPDGAILRQSERATDYAHVLRWLWREGLLYECGCTRADILAAASSPQEGVVLGPDGVVYPGTCAHGRSWDFMDRDPDPTKALRLDMGFALDTGGRASTRLDSFSFREAGEGPKGEHGLIEFTREDVLSEIGDIVVARPALGTSYHLSVVFDDTAQHITHVVRGQDLFEATKIHVVLQRLLGLPTPTYHHHKLIRDETGRRLAKREDAKAIRRFREEGATPADIRRMVGLEPSLAP